MLKFSARIPTVEYGYFEVESDNYDEFVQGVALATDAAGQLAGPPPAPPQQQPQQQPGQLPQVNGQGAPQWAAPNQQAQQQFIPPGQPQPPQGWPQVPPPGQQAPQQQGWQPSAPQQGAPSGAPMCAHGERNYVTGNGAKGPWKAWMCPTPKGTPGKCDPEWIK